MTRRLPRVLILTLLLPAALLAAEPMVVVDPPAVKLNGPDASYSLLVTQTTPTDFLDLTHDAHFQSSDTKIATVSASGDIRAVRDGSATITIQAGGRTLTVPVTVKDSAAPRKFNFENDIVPVLSRHGCNSSGCHGKAEGQNGFKLSVFGSDPPADYTALVKEARGRRVFVPAPDQSLLLRKVSGRVAHGGGVRIPPDSTEYEALRAWIAAGVPIGSNADPKVTAIRVEPRERLLAIHRTQQLRVIATWSDGRQTDVTARARFQSNNEAVAAVTPDGLVGAGDIPGDVAIMAAYMDQVDVFRALVPRVDKIANYRAVPENNFIDKHVFAKLKKLSLLPSDLCDDAEYLRRVYLDIIGTLPTAAEARRFLADKAKDKRARLVDELLQRPEYADYWALRWADILRVDRQTLGHKRAYAYYRWIRDGLANNRPYDALVRELLTAEGPLPEAPAGAFFKVVTKPGEAASSLSQSLLGVRIACAECHHHPFDRWSQADYQGMKAFFDNVSIRPNGRGAEYLIAEGKPVASHPRTGQPIHPYALGTKMPDASPEGDRRPALAAWMTAPENPWFARNLVNRTWAHFLGRGLIEPVDDVRSTNPPTNPELLDALAKHFIDSKYNQKQLIRTITASRTYQLASRPNATNEKDEQNYSRARLKRIQAEVLFDMVCQATGVEEKFEGVPEHTRAIQLWDSKVPHYFLKLFGRPERVSACECERGGEPGVAQVLHLLNSPEIQSKLSHAGGRIAKLVRDLPDDAALVEELYLTFWSRLPTDAEKSTATAHLKQHAARRQQAAEDLAWSLMNSLEFLFNH